MQITINFSEIRFIPSSDNQKAFSRPLDTKFKKVQKFKKFKDFPRTPPKIQGILKTVQTLLVEGGYAIYNKAQHLQSFFSDIFDNITQLQGSKNILPIPACPLIKQLSHFDCPRPVFAHLS